MQGVHGMVGGGQRLVRRPRGVVPISKDRDHSLSDVTRTTPCNK